MSRRAAIFAELSRLYAELAEIEGGAVGETPKAPRRRAAPVRVVPSPAPEEPMDEVSRMRAKKGAEAAAKILRSRGYPV